MLQLESSMNLFHLQNILLALLTSCLFFGFGCGGNVTVGQLPEGDGEQGDGDGDSGTGDRIQEDLIDVYQAMFEAECTLLFRCCGDIERESVFRVEGDEQDCKDEFASLIFGVDQAIIDNSVTAGRAALDEEQAQLCVASYLALSCNDWTTLKPTDSVHLPGCASIIAPLVQDGSACQNHFECFSGYCDRGMGESGNCRSRAGQGEDCGTKPCSDGYFCDVFSDVCIPREPNGVPCLSDKECESNYCAQVSDGSLSCQDPLRVCVGE